MSAKKVAIFVQTITWIDVDLSSMGLYGTYWRPISPKVLKISICKMSLKNKLVKLHPHLSEVNVLSKIRSVEMKVYPLAACDGMSFLHCNCMDDIQWCED